MWDCPLENTRQSGAIYKAVQVTRPIDSNPSILLTRIAAEMIFPI